MSHDSSVSIVLHRRREGREEGKGLSRTVWAFQVRGPAQPNVTLLRVCKHHRSHLSIFPSQMYKHRSRVGRERPVRSHEAFNAARTIDNPGTYRKSVTKSAKNGWRVVQCSTPNIKVGESWWKTLGISWSVHVANFLPWRFFVLNIVFALRNW